MDLITRLRIGTRLGVAFTIVLALLAGVAVAGGWQVRAINQNVELFSDNLVPSLKAIDKLRTAVANARRIELAHVMLGKIEEKDAFDARIAETRTTIDALVKGYEKLAVDAQDQRNLDAVRSTLVAYYAQWDALRPLSREAAGDPAKFEEAKKVLLGASGKAYGEVATALDVFWNYNEKLGEDSARQAAAGYRVALWMLGSGTLAAILLGVACAWAITRSITRPLGQAMAVAERIGAGDLSSRIDARGSDETAQLLAALKRMNDNLVAIVGEVRNSSDSIATGSTQISTGNADLSQRTEEQASNLQQTAASMEQLTATVRQNADTAREATHLAGAASSVAAQGGAMVSQVVQTMQQINDSSKKIADIIGVIDGIAFQTNILALNAAVEAARAGEQGRGFAVVAGEVRTLAQRSAQAAREIKTLIGESVSTVEAGSQLVDDAGRNMGEIVQQVKRVSDLISEISAASLEQSQGIEQIGDAVSQLDQVTQQNAALVEESAAAAESLKHQAHALTQTVARFKLEHAA